MKIKVLKIALLITTVIVTKKALDDFNKHRVMKDSLKKERIKQVIIRQQKAFLNSLLK